MKISAIFNEGLAQILNQLKARDVDSDKVLEKWLRDFIVNNVAVELENPEQIAQILAQIVNELEINQNDGSDQIASDSEVFDFKT